VVGKKINKRTPFVKRFASFCSMFIYPVIIKSAKPISLSGIERKREKRPYL
jgi:hypothetical protein